MEYSYNNSMTMATGMTPLYANYGPRRSEVLNPTDPIDFPGPKALVLGQRRIFKTVACSVCRCETKHSRSTHEGHCPVIRAGKKRSIAVNGSNEEPKRQRRWISGRWIGL